MSRVGFADLLNKVLDDPAAVASVVATPPASAECAGCSGMIEVSLWLITMWWPLLKNHITSLPSSYLRKTHGLREMLRAKSIQMPTVPIHVYAIDNWATRCLIAHRVQRGVEEHATATFRDLGQ